jgi:dimethylpropiothetin dethiomethylase
LSNPLFQPPASLNLAEDTDLFYLLREFETAYRYAPTGGSAPIRAHMRIVRERLAKIMKADPATRVPEPASLPATRHLGRALDNGEREPTEIFVRADCQDLCANALGIRLREDQPALARKYGYADILGPAGFVEAPDLALGFVLFAPGCVYPSHRHDGITESYIVLSGAVSENDLGVFRRLSMIFNAPGTTHTIRTSSNEPALLAYAWIGTPEAIAGHTMKFTRARKEVRKPSPPAARLPVCNRGICSIGACTADDTDQT